VRNSPVPSHLLVYVGVVVAIALLPGPDTAVVTKNALIHGREAALGSAIGVNVGLSVWTLATALEWRRSCAVRRPSMTPSSSSARCI